MRSDVTLLRAAAVCGAMILAAPAFAAGANPGASGINGTATSPTNGPMPSEQMDANAQRNTNAAMARSNATPPYSSTNSVNGVSSNTSGVATSSPRNLNGNAAGNTSGSPASQPPAVQ